MIVRSAAIYRRFQFSFFFSSLRRSHVLLAAALAALVAGCGRQTPPAAEKAEQRPKAATSQVQRGPVKLSVTVEPSPARLSDEPVLTLEIDYPQGITIRKPQFGSALGEFVIRDFREPLPRIDGDRQILKQIYTLEPTGAVIPYSMPLCTILTKCPEPDGPQ